MPGDNCISTTVNLNPDNYSTVSRDDCFRGDERYRNCNMMAPTLDGGDKCTHWHFYKREGEADIRREYGRILAGAEEGSAAVRKINLVKLEMWRILGLGN